jgi:hypothetical protein
VLRRIEGVLCTERAALIFWLWLKVRICCELFALLPCALPSEPPDDFFPDEALFADEFESLEARFVLAPDDPWSSESPSPLRPFESPSPSSRSFGVTTSRCEDESLPDELASEFDLTVVGFAGTGLVVVDDGDGVDVVTSA